MSLPSSFRYKHSDNTCIPRDMRTGSDQETYLDDYFFVGFRIAYNNEYLYQHALILADNHDSFINGIKAEKELIEDRYAWACESIVPIFVRNITMLSPEVIAIAESNNISAEINKKLARRNDHQFTVFGVLQDEQVFLSEENAADGMHAINMARQRCAYQLSKNLIPLDVRQAHPVTQEFEALFQVTAERILTLNRSTLPTGGYLH